MTIRIHLSPPGTPSPFTEKYGNLYGPMLIDGTALYLASKVTKSVRIAEVISFAAGVGAWAFYGRQTSTLINLMGAGVYLVYKAALHYILTRENPTGYFPDKPPQQRPPSGAVRDPNLVTFVVPPREPLLIQAGAAPLALEGR